MSTPLPSSTAPNPADRPAPVEDGRSSEAADGVRDPGAGRSDTGEPRHARTRPVPPTRLAPARPGGHPAAEIPDGARRIP